MTQIPPVPALLITTAVLTLAALFFAARGRSGRAVVLAVLMVGLSAGAAGIFESIWSSNRIQEQFRVEVVRLASACAGMASEAGASPMALERLWGPVRKLYPEVERIRLIARAGNEEYRVRKEWAFGAEKAEERASAGGRQIVRSALLGEQGAMLELTVSERDMNQRQLEVQQRVFGFWTGSLCLSLVGILALGRRMDRDQMRELDALTGTLKVERERLAHLVGSVKGMVWERGGRTGRLTLLGRSTAGFLGYPESRWKEDADLWISCIHADDRERVTRFWQSVSAGQRPYELVYRVRTADGGEAYIEEYGTCSSKPNAEERVFRGVFRDITKRVHAESAAQDARRIQVENSRQAGMAELATGVLHNVGNVLNTLNVSARLMADQLKDSKVHQLQKASDLMLENAAQGAAFFTDDARGKALPGYLSKVCAYLLDENRRLQGQMGEVMDRINHIRDVIVLQQKHGKVRAVEAPVSLSALIRDGLRLEEDALQNGGVDVEAELLELPAVVLNKSSILQILVNLINNARHAVAANKTGQRRVCISVSTPENGRVSIVVRDNGCGIPAHQLTRIFNHGFTTREDGHGFGLHHAALLAQDMGGRLYAESEGQGRGASFILELPFVENPASQGAMEASERLPKPVSNARPIAVEVMA